MANRENLRFEGIAITISVKCDVAEFTNMLHDLPWVPPVRLTKKGRRPSNSIRKFWKGTLLSLHLGSRFVACGNGTIYNSRSGGHSLSGLDDILVKTRIDGKLCSKTAFNPSSNGLEGNLENFRKSKIPYQGGSIVTSNLFWVAAPFYWPSRRISQQLGMIFAQN